ncbi:hypothetical protein ATCV1_z598R [Acanthocystis turfacea chlorella virus 1]|uniref:Uncharacterized protein z598R n=1 Tax=Chlorovirus heliozoae TaxID=322019 RepID=A7K9K8_9PHYC|nr:hypothetical protein ATCV1_z598R [Acanthocystis turfacea chlorella virus 1]ABT16732.1 hypothetical protein ATCV1_z598R [Acanthocystis turfacea chlorella virus 1]
MRVVPCGKKALSSSRIPSAVSFCPRLFPTPVTLPCGSRRCIRTPWMSSPFQSAPCHSPFTWRPTTTSWTSVHLIPSSLPSLRSWTLLWSNSSSARTCSQPSCFRAARRGLKRWPGNCPRATW